MGDLPYHLASSSLAGAAAAAFFGGAAFFLEKRATVLKEAGLEADGAGLVAPLRLMGFPSISDMPREAAAVDAAREAIALEASGECGASWTKDGGVREWRLLYAWFWWMWTCHVRFINMDFDWST